MANSIADAARPHRRNEILPRRAVLRLSNTDCLRCRQVLGEEQAQIGSLAAMLAKRCGAVESGQSALQPAVEAAQRQDCEMVTCAPDALVVHADRTTACATELSVPPRIRYCAPLATA